MVAFGAPAPKIRSKAKSYTEFIKRGTRTGQVKVILNNTGMFERTFCRTSCTEEDCNKFASCRP